MNKDKIRTQIHIASDEPGMKRLNVSNFGNFEVFA